MAVNQSEILKEAVAVLRDDAALLALIGEATDEPGKAAVYNHVPQDDDQPYVAIKWEGGDPFLTKDSTGFDGNLDHEVLTTHHGDKVALEVMDAIIAAYVASPIQLVSGRIICFTPGTQSVPTQVFETHRALMTFDVIVDASGVGGAPVPPQMGAAIKVADEGQELSNTPHKTLDFVGDGIKATDAGGSVAKIEIVDGSITLIDAVGVDKGKADLTNGVRNYRWNMAENGQLLPQAVPSTGLVFIVLVLTQQSPGSFVFTPPTGTRWDGGTPPTLSTATNARDVLLFMTDDGGATWDGFAAGIGMS